MQETFAIEHSLESNTDVLSFCRYQIAQFGEVCHRLGRLQRQQQIHRSHCHFAVAEQEQLECQ